MKDICLENYYRDNGKEYSGSYGKESVCNAGDPGSVPGLGRPLEKGMATTLVFLSGESHGQRNLTIYRPIGSQKSDMMEQLTFSFFILLRSSFSGLTLPYHFSSSNFKNTYYYTHVNKA